jgi:hypothetical protein
MKIALVGGLVRREGELAKLAAGAGHQLEWHCGDVGGRGAESLKAVIERSDVVVLLTEINSHGSMYLAKRVAQKLGREALVLRKCGPAKFQALLEQLAATGSLRGLPRCA